MTPFTIHADAETELRAAVDEYERREPGLGGEFFVEFQAALERVRANPFLYAADDDTGARHCPLHRFSYTLVNLDLEDQVWIAAIAHQRRRPGYWSRRRPG